MTRTREVIRFSRLLYRNTFTSIPTSLNLSTPSSRLNRHALLLSKFSNIWCSAVLTNKNTYKAFSTLPFDFWSRSPTSVLLNRFLPNRGNHSDFLKNIALQWENFEYQFIAVINSLSFSVSGPKVLAAVLPYTFLQILFPKQFQSNAYSTTSEEDGCSTASNTYGYLSTVAHLMSSAVDSMLLIARALYLLLLFAPAALLAPFAFHTVFLRQLWMELIRWTLKNSGPAFIKWGQWASTRHDLFPADLCHSLEQLQTSAPAHSGSESRRIIGRSLAYPMDQLFSTFEDIPVASGSIAQIHKAVLSNEGAKVTGLKEGTVVAVKVRHPGVTSLMTKDFALMQLAARVSQYLPGLSNLRLEESIRQFGAPLKEQLDLSVEAEHLSKFKCNFKMWSHVSFPTPIYPLIAPDVLVESFEEGGLISTYVNAPGGKYNEHLAHIGADVYMQMLLRDNFIHADLHPGNILVRESPKHTSSIMKLLGRWLDPQPRVVLLDTGMITQLTALDQGNLIKFFRALAKVDGEALARCVLDMSEKHTCKDQEAFIRSMVTFFQTMDLDKLQRHSAAVMRELIEQLRQHSVTLRPAVSNVMVTAMVLDGWSSKLHPEIRVLERMMHMVLTDWGDRISCTVDKLMSSGALVVA